MLPVTTRRPEDDGERSQRCGAVRAGHTTAAGGPRIDAFPQAREPVVPAPAPPALLARIERMRRVAVQLETATELDRRAGRAEDPRLAALLRERADAHRRRAERLRSV